MTQDEREPDEVFAERRKAEAENHPDNPRNDPGEDKPKPDDDKPDTTRGRKP